MSSAKAEAEARLNGAKATAAQLMKNLAAAAMANV